MRRRWIAVGCAALLVLSACGDDDTTSVAAATTPATVAKATTTTARATTTSSSTSTSSSTTTSSTSTTTTVPATLPNPEAVPADPRAPEPVIELGSSEIPKIGVVKSMFEGITLTTLDLGPGHWPGTAMPGQLGNVVIAGHRVSHDKPFRHLEQLEAGDDVILTTADGRFVYKVTSTEVVGPEALWIVDQTAEYTATLFACHPPGSTRQRIVVHLAYAPEG
jgi:sortase A